MLRITGGRLVRRRLKAPAGRDTRPTADRVKEALFNILGQELEGARVLDLFAGSGALGLEALSRGASWCVFVERSGEAAAVIRRNIADLGLAGRCTLLKGSVVTLEEGIVRQGPFDLVLADPPYDQGHVAAVLGMIERIVTPEGRLVLEHSPRERPNIPNGLDLFDHRAYGQTELSFIRRSGESAP